MKYLPTHMFKFYFKPRFLIFFKNISIVIKTPMNLTDYFAMEYSS